VLQTEKIKLAVFTPFNILANYIFPLKRALCAFRISRIAKRKLMSPELIDQLLHYGGIALQVFGATSILGIIGFLTAYYAFPPNLSIEEDLIRPPIII
jgi:hypothetical protein